MPYKEVWVNIECDYFLALFRFNCIWHHKTRGRCLAQAMCVWWQGVKMCQSVCLHLWLAIYLSMTTFKMSKFYLAICSVIYFFDVINCNTEIQIIVSFAEHCIAEEKYSFVNIFYSQHLDISSQFSENNSYFFNHGLRYV